MLLLTHYLTPITILLFLINTSIFLLQIFCFHNQTNGFKKYIVCRPTEPIKFKVLLLIIVYNIKKLITGVFKIWR
jgi:hypothetical protein